MTSDYKCHGATTLFAGMNEACGSVVGTLMPTHNHQDRIRFLKLIHQQSPQDRDVHFVLDITRPTDPRRYYSGWRGMLFFSCRPIPRGATRPSDSSVSY